MAKSKENSKNISEDNTMRLHIDEKRINDAESLDTSFLDGREQKKVVKNHKEKEKLLKGSRSSFDIESILKPIGFILFFLLIAVGGYYIYTLHPEFFQVSKKTVEYKEKEKIVYKVDENYLFIGDFHTEKMSFEEFLHPYVKVSKEDMMLDDVLEDMRENIYIYNPSVVVLELGMIDLISEVEEDTIFSNLEDIIHGIQRNRSLAKIYVESLYPVNSEMKDYPKDYKNIDNEYIMIFNKKLAEKMKSLGVTYVDIFEVLNEENHLKESYTEDGVTLNEDGYKRVMKVLQKEFIKE